MARFTVEGREFEILHASDVSNRDGLAWELWEHRGQEQTLVIEIFRHDDLNKIDFATFRGVDVPFEAIEILLEDFKDGGKDFIDYSQWE